MSPEARRAEQPITKVVVLGVMNHVLEVGAQTPDIVTARGDKRVLKITDTGGDRPELRVEYSDGTVDVLRNAPVIIRTEGDTVKCVSCGAPVSKDAAQVVDGVTGPLCLDCARRLRRAAREAQSAPAVC